MKLSLLAFFCLTLLFSSCTSSHINSNRLNEGAIPKDFNCKECVLLIIKRTQGRTINKYVEKSFTKNYSGKFEMVLSSELESNPKYKNKNIYRFIVSDQVVTGGDKIVTNKVTNTTTTTNNNTAVNNSVSSSREIQYNYTYTMDFRVYDRLKEKGYGTLGVQSNVPAKAINRTSVLLNKAYSE